MVLVRNKHSASVAGVQPGEEAEISNRDFKRYPWAWVDLSPKPPRKPPGPKLLPVKRVKEAIAVASDVSKYLEDPRPSVRKAAQRRLEMLNDGE